MIGIFSRFFSCRDRMWSVPVFTAIMVLFTACFTDSSKKSTNTNTTTNVSLSGSVATGAPVSGIVYITGQNGVSINADINADGSYDIDVSALTAPYLLKAVGTAGNKSVAIYSTALNTGTINITPVTDFIVRNALGGAAPDPVDWAAQSANINAAKLDAAESIIRTQLAPLLSAAGLDPATADLMSMSFTPDHTGMDLVLDALTIAVNGTTATVTNNFTGETFNQDLSSNSPSAGFTQPVTVVVADAAAIAAVWAELTAICSYAIPDSIPWLNKYLAAEFLNDGLNRAQQITDWSSIQTGWSFSTYILSSTTEGSYAKAYNVSLTYTFQGQQMTLTSKMVYDGTNWLWMGNRNWIQLDSAGYSKMVKNIDAAGAVTYSSGISFYINDKKQYAYNNGVRSMVATGNGLPAAGVALKYDSGFSSLNNVGPGGTSIEFFTPDDTTLATLKPNEIYTITLCGNDVSASINPKGDCTAGTFPVYTKVNTMPPVAGSTLTAAHFPTLTAPTSHQLSSYIFGTGVNFEWTNPAGITVNSIGIALESPGFYNKYENDVGASTTLFVDTSTNSFTPTSATFYIQADDIYMRRYTTFFKVQ